MEEEYPQLVMLSPGGEQFHFCIHPVVQLGHQLTSCIYHLQQGIHNAISIWFLSLVVYNEPTRTVLTTHTAALTGLATDIG